MHQKKAIPRKVRLEQFANERKKFIERIENSKIPFWKFIAFFLGIILIRFVLEVALSHYSNTLFDLPGFLLIFFFYISIAVSTIILFHIFTKTSIDKLSKVILPAFVLTIFPPLIDFLISGGKGFAMGYLAPKTNLIFAFFTMGGIPTNQALTIGIRLELVVFLFLSFYYFQMKNPSLIKNLIKTFFVYCMIFLYAMTPIILQLFLNIFSLKLVDYWYQTIYSSSIILIAIQILLILWIHDKKLLTSIAFDLRINRILHFLLLFLIGLLIGLKSFTPKLDFNLALMIILAPLAIFFAILFSLIQNNIHDFRIDSISNKNRPLQLGANIKKYNNFSHIFLFLSLCFAISAGITTLIATLLFALSYYIYSNPPFRLKQIPIVSKLLISFCSLLTILVGFIIAGGTLATFPISIVILFLIGFTLAINFIDIKDYFGDKKEKIRTLPVILGLKKSKLLISTFFIIAYALSYFVVEKIELIPFLILFSIIEVILINRREYNEKPVFIVYLLSLIIISIFYLI